MRLIKRLQQSTRNFFAISSTEANAFLILFPVILILLLLIPFYPNFFASYVKDHKKDEEDLKNLVAELKLSENVNNEENQDDKRFISSFDPNTASFSTLIMLEMDSIIAARLIKYRNSGGKFLYKEDLLKIYGIDEVYFNEISGKISLPRKPTMLNEQHNEKLVSEKKDTEDQSKSSYTPLKPFDINVADSLTLCQIRGIGPVLSGRIIAYRKLLGGFVDTVQFKEVYGLQPEVLQQMYGLVVIDKNFSPVKIALNEADASALVKHPYITWNIANTIVAYRRQHGKFKKLEQLKEIKLINEDTFDKIVPYLSL